MLRQDPRALKLDAAGPLDNLRTTVAHDLVDPRCGGSGRCLGVGEVVLKRLLHLVWDHSRRSCGHVLGLVRDPASRDIPLVFAGSHGPGSRTLSAVVHVLAWLLDLVVRWVVLVVEHQVTSIKKSLCHSLLVWAFVPLRPLAVVSEGVLSVQLLAFYHLGLAFVHPVVPPQRSLIVLGLVFEVPLLSLPFLSWRLLVLGTAALTSWLGG